MEETDHIRAMREAYEKRTTQAEKNRRSYRRGIARHYDTEIAANASKPGWVAEVSPGVYIMSRRPRCCVVDKLSLATRYNSHKAAIVAARSIKTTHGEPQAFHVNAQGERSSP